MRIGTKNYYADITVNGVSIFSHGVQKNFYPWGSGKDTEARETANNALELAENSVKKTTNIGETQTAGYNLRSQPIEGSNHGWKLRNAETRARIDINTQQEGGYISLFGSENGTASYIKNMQPDKNGREVGIIIAANPTVIEHFLVNGSETSYNQLYLRSLPNYSTLILQNTNLADESKSTMQLSNNAQGTSNIFHFTTTFKPNANVDQVYCRIYFNTLTMTMRKGSESRTLDLWELAAPPTTE